MSELLRQAAEALESWRRAFPDAWGLRDQQVLAALRSALQAPQGVPALPESVSECGLTECRGKPMCKRCQVQRGLSTLPEPAGFSAGSHDGALFSLKRSTAKNFAKGSMQPLLDWYSPAQMAACREAGRAEERARMRAQIADDAYAMTFQTLGQYRSALLQCPSN